MSLPNAPNISKQTDPYPADYKATIAAWLMSPGESDVLVSEPQLTDPWTITEARIWYVCVRRGATEFVAFLRGGHITDSLPGANPTYCKAAQYTAVVATPMLTTAL